MISMSANLTFKVAVLPAKSVKTIASVGKTQVVPRACFARFLAEVNGIKEYGPAAGGEWRVQRFSGLKSRLRLNMLRMQEAA
jgi:hypothetical protein